MLLSTHSRIIPLLRAKQATAALPALHPRLIGRPALPSRVQRHACIPAAIQTSQNSKPVAAAPEAAPKQAPAAPVASSLQEKVSNFIRSTAKAAAILGVAVALVLGNVNPALAARSAGRAGGFSAPAPSARSYGGGGGGYSGGRGYSGGYSSPYSSGYSTYRAPIIVPSPPIMVPAPMYPGTGMMVAPGAAVVTAGPDIVDIAIVSMFLVMAASAAATALKGADGDDDYEGSGFSQPTLTRVQVGLVSLARELKGDLDRIAACADTGSSKGLHQLLQEVVLAMLRNPKYCIYGASSQKSCSSTNSLEQAFNNASVKERSKFEQETLVNVGGSAARRSRYSPAGSSKPDELVVVTLLVATGCKVYVPAKINSLAELRQALEALGGLPQDQVMGVELLWTPQADGDYYTRDEIVQDYPHLRQL